jgi:hypothetical protein
VRRGLRAAFLAPLGLLAACSRPLPEEGSADAELYRARCGNCHVAYQPAAMTPTMWRLQIDRMEKKYRGGGQPMPTAEERERLLRYLDRHAQ